MSCALSYSRGSLIAFAGQIVLLVFLYGVITLQDVRYRRIARAVVRRTVLQTLLVVCISLSTFFAVNAVRGQFFDVQSAFKSFVYFFYIVFETF